MSILTTRWFIVLLAIGFFVLDVLTKTLVRQWLPLNSTQPFLPGVLQWTHVQNPGAAWSLFASRPDLLLILALVFCTGLLVMSLKLPLAHRLEQLIMALLLGGAFGNLLDRLLFGQVTDFIDLVFWPTYPIFNVADIWICSAVCCLFLGYARGLWQKSQP